MSRHLVRVELTDAQRREIHEAAGEVQEWARAVGARSYFAPPDQMHTTVNGFGAEVAAAVALGVPWRRPDPRTRHDGDLIDGTEVRSTRYATGKLLIRPEDYEERAFVLVTGMVPHFVIRGWKRCCESRRDEWWWPSAPERPCWAVPQEELRDIRTLHAEQGSLL